MSEKNLTHEDAKLVLKLYDLRREQLLRQSREILGKFWPNSFAELQELANPEHPHNAAYRQVTSYWEMAYSFVKYGIVDAEFFLEANGEGLFIFAKFEPFLEDIRKTLNPSAFKNTEWIATQTEAGKIKFANIKTRVASYKKMMAK